MQNPDFFLPCCLVKKQGKLPKKQGFLPKRTPKMIGRENARKTKECLGIRNKQVLRALRSLLKITFFALSAAVVESSLLVMRSSSSSLLGDRKRSARFSSGAYWKGQFSCDSTLNLLRQSYHWGQIYYILFFRFGELFSVIITGNFTAWYSWGH